MSKLHAFNVTLTYGDGREITYVVHGESAANVLNAEGARYRPSFDRIEVELAS